MMIRHGYRCSLKGILALLLPAAVLLATVAAASPAALELLSSDDAQITVAVAQPDLRVETVTESGRTFTSVEVPDYGFTSVIGAPRLPVLRSLVEVPFGAAWTVTIESPVYREIPVSEQILPLQAPRPKSGPVPPFAYDRAAYAVSGYSRAPLATVEEAGIVRGHRLAEIAVRAVDYDPARGMIRLLESARIRVQLIGADRALTEAEHSRYASASFDGILRAVVLNGDAQVPMRYTPGGEIGYLVISTPALYVDPQLEALLTARREKGFRVTHVSTDVTGVTKEAIKAYIQTAYDTWTVPPTFVVFVGDTPAIPHWVGIGADNPPTDLNYAMLEGADYLPDLQLGRLSVTNPTELHNLLAKMNSFEQVGWTGNNDWETHATFLASEDNYSITEGTHNFVITNYLSPLAYRTDKLYMHTYSATPQQVRDAFNAGRSQGTYSGHGAETYWADGPVFYQSDVRALTNTVYPFVQAYTCLSNNFSVTECFGETWIRTAKAGVAYFGSSVTSYWTEDDILEKRVYEGFYNDLNPGDLVDQTWIGGMILYGKLKYYAYFGAVATTRRYFEMYNLMGDPSIDVWTGVPRIANVTAPESLISGQTSFDVTVSSTPYAMISARKVDAGNTIEAVAWADQNGNATVNLPEALAPGSLHLYITAHNLHPYHGVIEVIQPSGPWLVYDSCVVCDPGGDVDAVADAGETIDLNVALRNTGVDPATSVVGTLSTGDAYVTLGTALRPFGTIPTGATVTCENPYGFSVAGTTPDQHVLPFTITAEGTEGSWVRNFNLTVQAPVLAAGSCLIDDSAPGGDGDGTADPGESVFLMPWVANSGHAAALLLNGTLSSTSPYVQILDAAATCGSVAIGGSSLFSAFQVQILPGCPSPTTLPLHVAIAGPNGFTSALDFSLSVGSFFDDMETDKGWTVGAPDDNATTGQWVRVDPIGTTATAGGQAQPEDDHTPDPGHICFVTGQGAVGGGPSDADVDGGKTTLFTPVFPLGGATSATVTYWRWYTNNLGNNPGSDYWDVDVTGDGTNWVALEHTTASANNWGSYTFNLGSFVTLTNQVRMRFVASDTGSGSLVEAAVDDFELTVVRAPVTDVPGTEIATKDGIVSVSPNPLRDRGAIAYRLGRDTQARLAIYDITGRLVGTLVDGPVSAGTHSAAFDARGATLNGLPSGVYFIRLETPEILQVRQVTLVR
jgi:hypothetical protein